LNGCLGEYKFAVMAMEHGFFVSLPLLDASPYDLLLDNGRQVFKIQVKSIINRKKQLDKNSVQINVRCGTKYYQKHEVDFFAIYYKETNGFFIIKNNQQKSIRINPNGKYRNNFNNFTAFY
jgi:hypothetical protein